jgi:hypothetical protein
MLEFLKLIVQPVVLDRNEEGAIVGEQLGQQTACYSREQVIEFLDGLEGQIAQENERKEETHVSE